MNDLKTIYDTYYDALYGFAYSILRSNEAVSDAIQDMFISAYKRLELIEDEEQIRRFLFSCLKNECITYLSKKRDYNNRIDRYAYIQEMTIGDEHEQIKTELIIRVSEEVSKLPPKEKKVIELRYYEGYKESEIPELMGVSLQTVKNKKTIVLKKLKLILNPQ